MSDWNAIRSDVDDASFSIRYRRDAQCGRCATEWLMSFLLLKHTQSCWSAQQASNQTHVTATVRLSSQRHSTPHSRWGCENDVVTDVMVVLLVISASFCRQTSSAIKDANSWQKTWRLAITANARSVCNYLQRFRAKTVSVFIYWAYHNHFLLEHNRHYFMRFQ